MNDMSAALKRRFNIVVLPTPGTLETEIDIVRRRVRELAVSLELRAEVPTDEAVEKVVTIFRELRTGQTLDGKNKLKTPSGVLVGQPKPSRCFVAACIPGGQLWIGSGHGP